MVSLAAPAVVPAVLTVSPALVVVGLVSLAFAIVVIVDMARRPTWQWATAGSNKTLWLVLEIVCLLLVGFISIIVGVLYFAMIRPKLQAVERQSAGPAWPQSPGWPGAVPPSQPPSWATGTYPPPVSGQPTSPVPGPPASSPPGPPASPPPGSSDAPPPGPPASPGAGLPTYPEAGLPTYPGAGLPTYPGADAPPPSVSAPPTPAEPPSAPPFGWYPDPSGHHERRYWDGTRWTEHVADGDQQSTEPIPE